MNSIHFIVFLPLLAAIVAGFSNRAFGTAFPKLVTTGALFVACGPSWPIFLSYMSGSAEPHVAQVFTWMRSGDLDVSWGLRVDSLTAVMLWPALNLLLLLPQYQPVDHDDNRPI